MKKWSRLMLGGVCLLSGGCVIEDIGADVSLLISIIDTLSRLVF